MLRAIDHIVILVRDLAAASANYAQAGFTVTPGGTHAGGATHNALVTFNDGTYFELIAFLEPDRPQERRWWSRLAQGDGLVDYALLSSGLPADAEAIRNRGLAIHGPGDGGRLRPDGQQIAWRSMMLGDGVGHPALPFVIEDVTPRELRVPGGATSQHALGVTRVAGLTLVVNDLAAATDAFARLLNQPGQPGTSTAGPLTHFTIGNQWLALLQPTDLASPAGQHLQTRGDGPYEISLTTDSQATPNQGDLLPPTLTHNVAIRIVR